IGEPTADLRSNIAAEARAKIIYERLINVSDDPSVREALGFLMTREVSHQKSFEKALYAITANFPPGKLPPMEPYDRVYFRMQEGAEPMPGPWNRGDALSVRRGEPAVDGGDGLATGAVDPTQSQALEAMARRLASDPNCDPTTGAELGAGAPHDSTTSPVPPVSGTPGTPGV
ncbi:manganese catalase family protein, partial [Burkholderia multivorans]